MTFNVSKTKIEWKKEWKDWKIFFNNVLYDVKVYAVKEKTVWKEIAVRNRTVVKMIWWEWLFHMILEIGKAVALMTSRRLQKESAKNLKRQMRMIELRRRWGMENVFSFASWDYLISLARAILFCCSFRSVIVTLV